MASGSGQQLSELFVDVTARGLDSTKANIDRFAGGLDAVKSSIDQMTSGFTKALIPVAALTAGIAGLAIAGLQGTNELYNMMFQFNRITKEVASSMLPIVDMLTSGFRSLADIMRGLGADGQRWLLGITLALVGVSVGLTAVITVLSGVSAFIGVIVAALGSVITALLAWPVAIAGAMTVFAGLFAGASLGFSEMRQALMSVWSAFVGLGEALWPVMKAIIGLGVALTESIIIKPIVALLFYLEATLNVITKIVDKLTSMSALLRRVRDTQPEAGRAVTSNDTGTETAMQTFSRIQEAALKINGESEIERNTSALDRLSTNIEEWINYIGDAVDTYVPPADAIVEGFSSPLGSIGRYGMKKLGID